MSVRRLVILGGGISGLSTAYYAAKAAREQELPLDITVVESSLRFGGAIRTQLKDGFLIEHGPDSFAVDKPAALELCRELGLDEELIGIDPDFRRILVRFEDQFKTLPKDFYLMAPARLRTLVEMPFLSPAGKLRMALEYFIPPRKAGEDESLGNFLQRRFGREMLERIGQPFLGSIFGCDLKELSAQSSFPRFLEMEKSKGSVIRGLRAMKKNQPPKPKAQSSEADRGLFLTFRGGMQRLVEKLLSDTPAAWLSGACAERVIHEETFKVVLRGGRVLEADALCLAMPAFQASKLFTESAPELKTILSQQPSKSMFVVHAAFPEQIRARLPKAAGFVGSADSQRKIQGASFASFKFAGRSPAGAELIRIFPGYQWHASLEQLCDEKIGTALTEEFRRSFGIKEDPLQISVSRHVGTMPLYTVGHGQWWARLLAIVKKFPGLYVCGNSYQGAGIPDCVKSAKEAAAKISQGWTRVYSVPLAI